VDELQTQSQIGILDWYTVLIGVMALVTLTAHGSYYVALKTDAILAAAPAARLAVLAAAVFLTFIALVATYFIRPDIMKNYAIIPIGIVVPIVVFATWPVMLWANPKGKEKLAFVASSLYITFMLVGAAFALYPVVLPPATTNTTSPSTTPPPAATDSRRPGLVDVWRNAGRSLLCIRLPDVSRQGASGRRTLLAIAEVRGQIAEVKPLRSQGCQRTKGFTASRVNLTSTI
jgi:hypothetical protein